MNVPPPSGPTIPIKTESGDPVKVTFKYAGIDYTLRIGISVTAVWATGRKDAQGSPEFGLNMSPVITVSKEGPKS